LKDIIYDMDKMKSKEQEICKNVPIHKKQAAAEYLKKALTDYDYLQLLRLYRDHLINKSESGNWFVSYHFNVGMNIRNLLRNENFGEEYFGFNLDFIYVELLEMAIGVR